MQKKIKELLAVVLVVFILFGCVFSAQAETDAVSFEYEGIGLMETDLIAEATEAIENPILPADNIKLLSDSRSDDIEEVITERNTEMLLDASTGVSKSAVLQWMNSAIGRGMDYDGRFGNQCVDVAWAYLREVFGIPDPIAIMGTCGTGAAYGMWYNSAPTGWSKISGNTSFEIGDIVIWSGGDFGHVGLVYSNNGSVSILQQNYNGESTCQVHRIHSVGNILGVFRPTFASDSTVPSVVFSPWEDGRYTYIRETDASIGQQIDVAGGTCTEAGMYLYDQNGKQLGKAGGGYYYRVYFKINKNWELLCLRGQHINISFMQLSTDRPFGVMKARSKRREKVLRLQKVL